MTSATQAIRAIPGTERTTRERRARRGVITTSAARRGRMAMLAVGLALASACSLDGILKSDELPPDVTDPAITRTREGAIAAYNGLQRMFADAFGGSYGVVDVGGLLADELQPGGTSLGKVAIPIDARTLFEGLEDDYTDIPYSKLQKARGQASQAVQLLLRYAPEERALAGHAYVLQAYTEIFLAELFCSGIPLSTLDFDGDFTLAPGSTTVEVYDHALALLDSALVLVEGDDEFLRLAHVARARALLGRGDLEMAASEAAQIPDGWSHSASFQPVSGTGASNFARISLGAWNRSVADLEGVNGLDYRVSGDPRTAATRTSVNQHGAGIFHPDKYAIDGGTSIVLASGVEARLVEAEAALAAGEASWLPILNALRTDGTFTVTTDPANPAVEDTTWHAGSGGTEGLAPLDDPIDPDARLDLLFRERAFWLFLTGQRQADMRRLVRLYGREDSDVYPTGAYPVPTGESYGSDVTLPIPSAERVANPRFNGCITRDA